MGGNTSKVTAQDKAILDMKTQRDRLHQYQRRITVLTDRETEIARQMLARGDRPRALLALRRKKYQQGLLASTDAQLEQLEQLTAGVEFARVQRDVVAGLERGARVLREIQREMGGLDHVEKLMGDTAEAVAYQREVSEMLAGAGGRLSGQDEGEVDDELAAIEAEVRGVAGREDKQEERRLPEVPAAEVPLRVPGTGERPVGETETRQAMLAE